MPVLTSDEMLGRRPMEPDPAAATERNIQTLPAEREDADLFECYIWPARPEGKTSVSLYEDPRTGVEEQIELEDGVFTVPAGIELAERLRLRRMLLTNGFIEGTYYVKHGAASAQAKAETQTAPDREVRWTLAHPDLTDAGHGPSARIMVNVARPEGDSRKKRVALDLEDGRVTTDDELVRDALVEKRSYRIIGTERVPVDPAEDEDGGADSSTD